MSATLDPLQATRRIVDGYRSYLLSTFRPRRRELREEFEATLKGEFRLAKGPFLQASAPFVAGRSVAELIDEERGKRSHLRLVTAEAA